MTSVEVLSAEQFDRQWRESRDSVFSGRMLDEELFAHADWRRLAIGAPAHYFSMDPPAAGSADYRHWAIYLSLSRAIEQRGDRELVGALVGGPHLNAWAFHARTVEVSVFLEMRTLAVDGFDLQVFGPSARWGLAVSWEEEVALVAGDRSFMDSFVQGCGGEDAVRADFLTCSAYLESVSERGRLLRKHLLAQSRWQ